jgi:hypothetical protein
MRTRTGRQPNPFGTGFNTTNAMAGKRPQGPVPAFALNFIAESLSAAVTFSRASNATQFDSLGRLVWAPVNLCTRADMLSGGWVPSMAADGTVVSSTTPPPVDADCVRATWTVASPAAGCTISTLPVTVGTDHTFSIYLRYVNWNWFRIIIYSTSAPTNQARIWVDLQNLVVGTVSAGGTATVNSSQTGIELLADGWVRVYVTGNCAWSSSSDAGILFTTATADASGTRVGNGAAVDACGPLLEPTSINSPQDWSSAFFTAGSAYYGPRLDYNPATLTARGLLVEEARTNSLTGSNSWVASGAATIAQNATDPFGFANKAYTLSQGSGVTNAHFGQAGSVTTTAAGWAVSAFVKAGTADRCQLTISSSSSGEFANFSLVGSGSVLLQNASANAAIVALADGWYRISYSATMAAAIGSVVVVAHINSDTAGRIVSFTGTGLTVLVSWAQVELGLFATSLIPTFGVAATRAADTVTSAEIAWATAQPAAAMVVDIDGFTNARVVNSIGFVQLDDTTTANRIGLRAGGNNGQNSALFVSGGVVNINLNIGASDFNRRKVALSWDASTYSFSRNGAMLVSAAANGGTPTGITRISFGGSTALGSIFLNGWIRSFSAYSLPSLMTDTQLQALTA